MNSFFIVRADGTLVRIFKALILVGLFAQTQGYAQLHQESQDLSGRVDRIGPPTIYSAQVDRFRFGATDVSNPAFYPIPNDAVTRETYLAWLDDNGLFPLVDTPKLGESGPQRYMPILVKYVQTGERRYGEAIVAMLKDWHRAVIGSFTDQKPPQEVTDRKSKVYFFRIEPANASR